MGLFDKLKRNQKTPQSAIEPQPNTGVILLFDRPDIEHKEFEIAIAQNYGEHTILQIDTNSPSCIHLMLHIDGMDVVCSYMPFALPPEEADFPTLFGMNYCISDEERKALAEQNRFAYLQNWRWKHPCREACSLHHANEIMWMSPAYGRSAGCLLQCCKSADR